MRLSELNPRFLDAGGDGVRLADGSPAPVRTGVAVDFDCPCGCDSRCTVPFRTALDGKVYVPEGWERTGETFETLTLKPSILRNPRRNGCGWHGFITNGEVLTC